MKAMIINQFSDIPFFEEATLAVPSVLPGHVLIKVMASSVNPLDCKLRKGVFPDLVPSFPAILHGDVAGRVEAVGEGVTQFSVGDEVYGCAGGLCGMGGALADYMLADAALLAKKPKTLSFAESAALPLVSLTAWEGLISYANLQKGQRVLVHGGTGGVGHLALQLAKYLGAQVFTTSSTDEKMALSKKLGADVAINYRKTDVKSYIKQYTNDAGFDLVFDTVGGKNLPDCFQAASLFGKVISILAAGQYDLTPAFSKGLTLHTIMQPLPLITRLRRAHYGEILMKIAYLVDQGSIHPLLDHQTFNFNDVGKAHFHLESGKAIGKIVLTGFSNV
ncbi:MAG: zinc-dependent alcohol dehydrogenase family protein [Gammaproteobacteria bacterium]|nr:zinc-dependent alcohol dehydrogenase family protein [Gammaproteobacteria bacterium]